LEISHIELTINRFIIILIRFGKSMIKCILALPLSGMQESWGGVANSSWWPAHSKGVLEAG